MTWKARQDRDDRFWHIENDGHLVAITIKHSNAELIEAAPEMLALLKRLTSRRRPPTVKKELWKELKSVTKRLDSK